MRYGPELAAGAVAIASGALFAWGIATGWPGAPECTEGCFCELIRPDAAIAQPANTWSCLGFVAVGLWIARDAGRRRRAGVPSGRFSSDEPWAASYAAVVVFLGPGAMYFHAGMVHWGGRLDVLSMYLFIAFLLVYAVVRIYHRPWRDFAIGYAALCGLLVVDLLWRDGSSVPVFAPLVALACSVELLDAIPRERLALGRPPSVRVDRRWALGAAGCFFTALAIWLVSDTGGPLCDPDSPWQGHAAWHLLAAGSALCLYLYYRSESRPENAHARA